jgi:hypothetical protein
MVGGCTGGGGAPPPATQPTHTQGGRTPCPLSTSKNGVCTAPTQITITYYTQWRVYRHHVYGIYSIRRSLKPMYKHDFLLFSAPPRPPPPTPLISCHILIEHFFVHIYAPSRRAGKKRAWRRSGGFIAEHGFALVVFFRRRTHTPTAPPAFCKPSANHVFSSFFDESRDVTWVHVRAPGYLVAGKIREGVCGGCVVCVVCVWVHHHAHTHPCTHSLHTSPHSLHTSAMLTRALGDHCVCVCACVRVCVHVCAHTHQPTHTNQHTPTNTTPNRITSLRTPTCKKKKKWWSAWRRALAAPHTHTSHKHFFFHKSPERRLNLSGSRQRGPLCHVQYPVPHAQSRLQWICRPARAFWENSHRLLSAAPRATQ